MNRNNWVGFLPFYLLIILSVLVLASGGSFAVSSWKQNEPIPRQHTIVVDAGHGGIDGGATSCTGVLESSINLMIAQRLDDLLHFLGHNTVMIRTTDTSVYTEGNTIAAQKLSDLKERVRMTKDTPNAILVSIHQNTFSDSRYSGAQVFYGGAEESRSLAQAMQQSFISTLNPGSNRKAKKATGVYLLENITCVGVLVECGFLSNPAEETVLRQQSYQQKLCCVIATSLSQFLCDWKNGG